MNYQIEYKYKKDKKVKTWYILNRHIVSETMEKAQERLEMFQLWDKNAGLTNEYRIVETEATSTEY
jgi:hypothetical protein